MSALTSHRLTTAPAAPTHRKAWWQPDVIQMMDDHHLVAWSGLPRNRLAFGSSIAAYLESMQSVEVLALYGRHIEDLESFCYQLERAAPGAPLHRTVEGLKGVTALLRNRQAFPGKAPARFRYFIWHDADVLLRANPTLFARLSDALMGVAAEAEYADDDLLVIQRTCFIGAAELQRAYEDQEGPFRAWHATPGQTPFWKVVTGLDAPLTKGLAIDNLS